MRKLNFQTGCNTWKPFLIEGPVDAEVFTVYLERALCPQLREGDTLILDNRSTHKIQNLNRLQNKFSKPKNGGLFPVRRFEF